MLSLSEFAATVEGWKTTFWKEFSAPENPLSSDHSEESDLNRRAQLIVSDFFNSQSSTMRSSPTIKARLAGTKGNFVTTLSRVAATRLREMQPSA